MKKFFLLFSLAFCSHSIGAMDKPKATILAIPGQNGLGSEPEYIQNCFGDDVDVRKVKTPSLGIDFGQKFCMKHLSNAIKLEKNKNLVIHATSQGTATALNYLATMHKNRKNQNKEIKALILESAMISGNNAIEHTVQGDLMKMPFLTRLPFSYYWLPYCCKVLFPLYKPSGKQVIKSIKNLPKDIPVVIIHSKNDQQLPCEGAFALYYGLRSMGNNNVYIICKNYSEQHLNLLCPLPYYITQIIYKILHTHNIAINDAYPAIDNSIDLKQYQPNPDGFKGTHDDILNKELWHEKLWYLGFASCTAIISYILYKKLWIKKK